MTRFFMLLLAAVMTFAAAPASAQLDFSTKAKFAILMDFQSGTVLFQKSADDPMEPASMAKLMTIAVVFDMLQNGSLSLTDEFFISEFAWRHGGAASGGSTMFAELGSKVRIEDLLRSVIIQSGNDAAIALAEGIGGSEPTFARIMNEMSDELSLTDSNFTNSTGLPDPLMRVTARDLARLARHVIKTYPEYYYMFAEESFTWNNIRQRNRNTLLDDGIGVDGLKTGHTEAAGYGTVVSTNGNDRRLIAVLHGLGSIRERSEEARKLVTWGARSFQRVEAFDDGEIVGYAAIYGGETAKVGLVGDGPISLYLPKGAKRCLSAKISYRAPIMPPIDQGAEIAALNVYCDDQLIQSAPLFAAQTVEKGGLVRRATDALKELALGWL